MKAFVQNLMLMLAATLLGLAGLEAVCWTFAPPPKPGLPANMLEIGPQGFWWVTPGFRGVMDNRVDFTSAEVNGDQDGRRVVPAAPQVATRRVVVLGDSLTFGHGVSDEESWPNRLQVRLNQRDTATKVLNYAIPGTNIGHYKTQTDLLAPGLTPMDTVLVGVSWNDLITPEPKLQDHGSPPAPTMQVVEGHLVSVSSESRDSIAARVQFYKWSGIVVPPFQGVKSLLDGLSQNSALTGLLYPHAKAIYYRFRQHNPVLDLVDNNVPEGNFIYLAAMRDRIEARGARMVVVLLPERQFLEDATYNVYSAGGRGYPSQDYQYYLAKPLCRIYQIHCVNAFGLLHEHQAEGLVFRIDGHYNAKATALLGPWLADQIYPPSTGETRAMDSTLPTK